MKLESTFATGNLWPLPHYVQTPVLSKTQNRLTGLVSTGTFEKQAPGNHEFTNMADSTPKTYVAFQDL